jgi:uncharacterized membrane protein
MVKMEFKELEEYTAEVSLIIIGLVLIVLMTVFPSPNTTELYKDLLFIIIGALAGLVGGKTVAKVKEPVDNDKIA